jgi:parvulin-like peptidyl-prolyl isomerase
LTELRARAVAGESFEKLAREYSQSETRLIGGRIGWIGRGRMPSAIDDIAFSLGKGEISEPVEVRGGAVLLMVSEVVEEKQLGFDDAEILIDERLRLEAAHRQVEAALEGYRLPDDAFVIPEETLETVVSASVADDPVLIVSGSRVTAGEFVELIEERVQRVPGLPFLTQNPQLLYRSLVDDLSLLDHLNQTGFIERPGVAEAVDEQLERAVRGELYRRRMEEAILEEVSSREEALTTFFANNRFLYQTQLRVKLQILSAAVGSEPDRIAARFSRIRSELADGSVSFGEASRRVGAETRDLGWLTSQQLDRIDPKVKVYVLDLHGPGFTVPFQLNRQMHIIRVEQWEDPEPLEFDEVADQVRLDYMARHQQEIYRDVVVRILTDVDFRFFDEAVLSALGDTTTGAGVGTDY